MIIHVIFLSTAIIDCGSWGKKFIHCVLSDVISILTSLFCHFSSGLFSNCAANRAEANRKSLSRFIKRPTSASADPSVINGKIRLSALRQMVRAMCS